MEQSIHYVSKSGFCLDLLNNHLVVQEYFFSRANSKSIFTNEKNELYYFIPKDLVLLETDNVLNFQQKYVKVFFKSDDILKIVEKYKTTKTIDKYLNDIELKTLREEDILIEIRYSFRTKKEMYYVNKKRSSKTGLIKQTLNTSVANIDFNKTNYCLNFHFLSIFNLIDLLKQYNSVETIFKLNLEGLTNFINYKNSVEEYYDVSEQNMKTFYKIDSKYQSFRLLNNISSKNIIYLIESIDSKYINLISDIFKYLGEFVKEDEDSSLNSDTMALGNIYSFYKDYKINPKHVLDYIYNSIYISQCVGEIDICLEEYSMYLINLREYKNIFDIKIDKKLLYPKHLLSEKRKLVTLINKEIKNIEKINIKKNQEQNFIKYKIEKLNNNNNELYFDIPKSTKDLIKGANALNNCLKGYGDRLARNVCFISYIYKKEDLNKLYGAIEIRDNRIYQSKIKNNEEMPNNFIALVEKHLNILKEVA